jgi:hypothetical protein
MRPSMTSVGYLLAFVAAVTLGVDIGWTWG